jgi:mannose-6-phosphate isomerase-like protein (cupin superfamily)
VAAVVVHAPDITPEPGPADVLVRTLLAVPGTGGTLTRRLVDVPPGGSVAGTAGPAGELWFVITGRASLAAAGRPPADAGPQHGLRLPPGAGYRLRAGPDGPVQLDAVILPGQPAAPPSATPPSATPPSATPPSAAPGAGPLVADPRECPAEVTGDRRFRVLFGPGRGCAEATQFLGEIPPGRAPEHRHPYDEVVLILAGSGVAHIGGADHELAPGSCVHLPPGTPHCLENTGRATLVVLGVFHPGGSPAAKLPPGPVT